MLYILFSRIVKEEVMRVHIIYIQCVHKCILYACMDRKVMDSNDFSPIQCRTIRDTLEHNAKCMVIRMTQ